MADKKVYELDKIRNIGIIAHIDAGKTTTTERILFYTVHTYKVPRICFVNKMDKLGADFLATIKSIEDRLGANPAIMVLPIGSEHTYIGNVDLLTRQSYKWGSDELGAKFDVLDEVPGDMKD